MLLPAGPDASVTSIQCLYITGLYDVLICTALLARGMDLANVEHVLLYHSPRSAEEYVHTVGRTARANRHGISIVLINEQEERRLKKYIVNTVFSLCIYC